MTRRRVEETNEELKEQVQVSAEPVQEGIGKSDDPVPSSDKPEGDKPVVSPSENQAAVVIVDFVCKNSRDYFREGSIYRADTDRIKELTDAGYLGGVVDTAPPSLSAEGADGDAGGSKGSTED